MRLLKFLVVLVLVAMGGLAGYAYFGDMAPRQTEMRVPIATTMGAGAQGE